MFSLPHISLSVEGRLLVQHSWLLSLPTDALKSAWCLDGGMRSRSSAPVSLPFLLSDRRTLEARSEVGSSVLSRWQRWSPTWKRMMFGALVFLLALDVVVMSVLLSAASKVTIDEPLSTSKAPLFL